MSRLLLIFATTLLFLGGLRAQNQGFDSYIAAGDTAVAKKNFYNGYKYYAIACEDGWSESRNYEERISEVLYKAGLAKSSTHAFVVYRFESVRCIIMQYNCSSAMINYRLQRVLAMHRVALDRWFVLMSCAVIGAMHVTTRAR